MIEQIANLIETVDVIDVTEITATSIAFTYDNECDVIVTVANDKITYVSDDDADSAQTFDNFVQFAQFVNEVIA